MTDNSTRFGDSELEDRFPAWTRGNAADVFSEPFRPLRQSLVLRQGLCRSLRNAYISVGGSTPDSASSPISFASA
jgi:rifampicin phosphotransferase